MSMNRSSWSTAGFLARVRAALGGADTDPGARAEGVDGVEGVEGAEGTGGGARTGGGDGAGWAGGIGEQGGEETTAGVLARLNRRGWAVLCDLGVPGSSENLDFLVIGPQGQVVLVDAEHWSAADGATVGMPGGRLSCGAEDRQELVDKLRRESRMVEDELGAVAEAVAVVEGVPVDNGVFRSAGVWVVGPEHLWGAVLQAPTGHRDQAALVRLAKGLFPPLG
ncbi:NERD domain-containing protein [Streptomyces sp. Y1]|uniref:NERD domain-containing protein n=1 Tax=Streptomyces sp. Y1 TaxID=3238634 RepID=A0AB39TG33_9ACTN